VSVWIAPFVSVSEMRNVQSTPGKIYLLLIVVIAFFTFCLGFVFCPIMGTQGNTIEKHKGNTPEKQSIVYPVVTCPPCVCNFGGTVSSFNPRDSSFAFLPRPYIKRAQEALMDKVKRHEANLNTIWLPWTLFESTYECMMGEDRIGLPGEGGKWICGVNSLLQKPKCVVYSMGSNGQHDFEDDIMAFTQCEIHTFDMDDFSNVFKGTRVHFHKSKIGNGKDGTQSITGWMKELNHTYIDVLKIDVEGGEFPAFEELLSHDSQPWIGQLLIEIHLLGVKFRALKQPQKYEQLDKVLRLVEHINNLGLVQFHREENPAGDACEFCFGNMRPRPPV